MRWHFFFLTAYVIMAATDANPTSATLKSADHTASAHVPSQAATQANPTSEAHGTTDHPSPTHVVSQAATDANPTSEAHGTTDHLRPTHGSSQAATDANPTSEAHGTADHLSPTHGSSQGSPTEVPTKIPKAHAATQANPTSEAHGKTDRLAPTHGSSQVIGSLSKPTLYYNFLGSTMHITCFSKSGPLPIRYQLFLNDSKEQEKTVLKAEPANFTISATPGTKVRLNCTAISQTDGTSSSEEAWVAVDQDDSPTDDTETEQGKDGPEYLIPLQYILTSLTPAAIETNKLVLIICGSLLLAIFVIFILITYLRGQKKQKKAEPPVDERSDLLLYPNLVYYKNLLCYRRLPQIPLKKPVKREKQIYTF